jgi:hypothetical protein
MFTDDLFMCIWTLTLYHCRFKRGILIFFVPLTFTSALSFNRLTTHLRWSHKVNIKYFNTLVYAYITKKPYFDSKHLKISIDYVEKSRVKTLVSINQCVEILYIDLRIYSNTHFIWPQNVPVIGHISSCSWRLAAPESPPVWARQNLSIAYILVYWILEYIFNTKHQQRYHRKLTKNKEKENLEEWKSHHVTSIRGKKV